MATNGTLKITYTYKTDPEKINGAAAGVLSNVDDLCQWMLVHLNKGKYGENLEYRLFSENSQREMWKIHTTINVKPDDQVQSTLFGIRTGLATFRHERAG